MTKHWKNENVCLTIRIIGKKALLFGKNVEKKHNVAITLAI